MSGWNVGRISTHAPGISRLFLVVVLLIGSIGIGILVGMIWSPWHNPLTDQPTELVAQPISTEELAQTRNVEQIDSLLEISDQTLLERIERIQDRAIAEIGSSLVTIEQVFLGGGQPEETLWPNRTGIVLNSAGDVATIGIGEPPAGTRLVVIDQTNRSHLAKWIARDPLTDVVLIRVQPGKIKPTTDRVGPIQPLLSVVVAGQSPGVGTKFSTAQISGVGRQLAYSPRPIAELIEITGPFQAGEFGAVVADYQGDWLGLVRSGLACDPNRTVPCQPSPRYAISAQDVRWVIKQLRESGRVDRAYLGISFDRPSTRRQSGVSLKRVWPSGPADQAGLQARDRIVAIADQPIETPSDLAARLDRTLAGSQIKLTIIRDDQELIDLFVTTGSRNRESSSVVATPVTRGTDESKLGSEKPSEDLMELSWGQPFSFDRIAERLMRVEVLLGQLVEQIRLQSVPVESAQDELQKGE